MPTLYRLYKRHLMNKIFQYLLARFDDRVDLVLGNGLFLFGLWLFAVRASLTSHVTDDICQSHDVVLGKGQSFYFRQSPLFLHMRDNLSKGLKKKTKLYLSIFIKIILFFLMSKVCPDGLFYPHSFNRRDCHLQRGADSLFYIWVTTLYLKVINSSVWEK